MNLRWSPLDLGGGAIRRVARRGLDPGPRRKGGTTTQSLVGPSTLLPTLSPLDDEPRVSTMVHAWGRDLGRLTRERSRVFAHPERRPLPKRKAAEVVSCPTVQQHLELVGSSWTGAVLMAMLADARRYSESKERVPGLSDRMLSDRLRDLEAPSILQRTVVRVVPVSIQYALTETGRALRPVFHTMSDWCRKWGIPRL